VRQLPERRQILLKAFEVGIDDRIGTKGRNDAALESGRPNGPVMRQGIQRRIRCGQNFQPKPFEQHPGAELQGAQLCCNCVVIMFGRFFRESLS